jgi:hypothetical protein
MLIRNVGAIKMDEKERLEEKRKEKSWVAIVVKSRSETRVSRSQRVAKQAKLSAQPEKIDKEV